MDATEAPRVYSQRYELVHLIARGGMAEVYRAHDRLLDRPVALKVLFPELSVDRSFVERFRREAQAAANLSHPNIVPVFDWGEDSGTYFIVMEFVDGKPLSAILKAEKTLSADRAADIGAHVAAALGYAHKHGVVHRDVKPGNVLITDDGQVKVTDFGIARAINTEESLTQTGAVMGTATYFSPEQAEGIGVDKRSDIYSLGVVLFEAVAGRPPFLGDTPVAVASKHVRDHPPAPREINPAVPAAFEAVVLKSMAKDPDNRYQTAEDMRADLLRFSAGHEVQAASEPTTVQSAVTTTQAIATTGVLQATPKPGAEPGGPGREARHQTRNYAIVLTILVVLLLVVGFFFLRSLGYLGGNASFSLPNEVGKTVQAATSDLQGDGLKVRTVNVLSSQTPGTVIGQDPKARSLVKKGWTVTLQVASQPQTTVPSGITQTSLANAEQILANAGLQYKTIDQPDASAAGTVIKSDPPPGASIAQGGTVTLTVSSGPSATVVPQLAGLNQVQAGNAIAVAGLAVGQITYASSTSVAQNLVISSSPSAGTAVQPGSTVDLVLSSGPPPPTTTTTSTSTTVPSSTTTSSSTTSTTTPPHP